MDKKELKKQLEEQGLKIAGVTDVWSNGKSSRRYIGQDKKGVKSNFNRKWDEEKGFKKMVAVYIEVNELDSKD